MISKRPLSLPRLSMLSLTMTFGLIAILGLVIVSPFALKELTHSGLNWYQLSSIGQTYGAVSALVSSLALGGVAISLVYQARDSQVTHEIAGRRLQHDLLKMELEDVSLMNAFGAPYDLPISSDFASLRQFLFVQMWVSFLAGNYAIGESSEAQVRLFAADELFRSVAGRSYWEAAGRGQLRTSKGRRNRFFRLLDDEYKKAVSCNVPIANSVRIRDPSTSSRSALSAGKERARQLELIVAAGAIGALAGRFLRHRSG